jgi:beta-galactosidase
MKRIFSMKRLIQMRAFFAFTFIFIHLIGAAQIRTKRIKYHTDVFLYGASVYPEIQTKEEQIKMLDLFQKAGYTSLRLGESAWGNLEPASGKFNFGWLRFFLDEMHKRGIKAILGTCSYIPPQWLVANHPEALWQYEDGHYAHPMGRHSMSRNHPLFRKELEKFLIAYATAFKDHPAVIGWQLDNEIEHNINFRVDYNAVNKKSWTEWLHKTYKTTDELNRRLGLKAWGLQTDAIKNIWMPSKSNDGDLPILRLTMLHFQKDDIMEYFRWQKAILQRVGIEDWITTDWIMINHTIADEPEKTNPIDISGINQYQPTNNDPKYWAYQAFMNDLHRSVNGNGKFLVTETRIGVTGSEKIWTPAPSHQQFMTWMMQPAAFGASGLMHWSANRYTGGHWPHWGGILDWSENPEPDFQWTTEIAAFYKKWGKTLISEPVKSTAAVLTDFDQRATLRIYTHTPSAISSDLLTEAFDAFHRNGIGVDALNTVTAADYENLKKYQILVIASAVCLDEQKLLPALTKFVQNGGLLIVTPFTGYQTWDGLFKKTGFAAGLNDLTGTAVQTVRLLQEGGTGQTTVTWKVWSKGSSVVGMEGFTEILNVKGSAQVIASFVTNEEVMNGKAAATQNKVGNGSVIKLGFWPANDGFAQLVHHLAGNINPYLREPLEYGVQSVPRADNSLFLVNTLNKKTSVTLARRMNDRITGAAREASFQLQPFETLWLE